MDPDRARSPRLDVAIVGDGRVGSSFASALERAGHRIVARIGRTGDPSQIARADVIVIAVPDDALDEAVRTVATERRPDAVVIHTCGSKGLQPLVSFGERAAAIHPAVPVAGRDQPFEGQLFGVTCPDALGEWCERFVADLGGTAVRIAEEDRARYHAALVIASNFAVALAGDAADLAGDLDLILPLMRRALDNVAALGADAALTGPAVRGDAGTIRAHLAALPHELVDAYVANTRRTVTRARAAGRLDAERAGAVLAALDGAVVR